MTTGYKGASEKKKMTQYVTNTVLPHAIRPRTLKNPNQRLVATGGEEDHQPHSKIIKHTMDRSQNYALHFICITFHLHYI